MLFEIFNQKTFLQANNILKTNIIVCAHKRSTQTLTYYTENTVLCCQIMSTSKYIFSSLEYSLLQSVVTLIYLCRVIRVHNNDQVGVGDKINASIMENIISIKIKTTPRWWVHFLKKAWIFCHCKINLKNKKVIFCKHHCVEFKRKPACHQLITQTQICLTDKKLFRTCISSSGQKQKKNKKTEENYLKCLNITIR